MKKLTLKLDDLRVETFQTSAESARRGTVLGHGPTAIGNTCDPSCPYTCGIVPQTADCDGFAAIVPGNTDDCPVCV